MYVCMYNVFHLYFIFSNWRSQPTLKGWTGFGAGRTDVFLPAPLDLADFPEVLTSRYLTRDADGMMMHDGRSQEEPAYEIATPDSDGLPISKSPCCRRWYFFNSSVIWEVSVARDLGTIYSFTDVAFLSRRDVAQSLLKGVIHGRRLVSGCVRVSWQSGRKASCCKML